MGQTISYRQGEDGFFYGTYNATSISPFGLPLQFGPAYKVIAPGSIPIHTIHDIKQNVIFVPEPGFGAKCAFVHAATTKHYG